MKPKFLFQEQLVVWHHLIEQKKITAAGCMEIFPDISRPTINNDLSRMQELGLIHSIGASYNTYYESSF